MQAMRDSRANSARNKLPKPRDKAALEVDSARAAIASGRLYKYGADKTVVSATAVAVEHKDIPVLNTRRRDGKVGRDCPFCRFYGLIPPGDDFVEWTWDDFLKEFGVAPYGAPLSAEELAKNPHARRLDPNKEVLVHYWVKCEALQFCIECHVADNPADAQWNLRMGGDGVTKMVQEARKK